MRKKRSRFVTKYTGLQENTVTSVREIFDTQQWAANRLVFFRQSGKCAHLVCFFDRFSFDVSRNLSTSKRLFCHPSRSFTKAKRYRRWHTKSARCKFVITGDEETFSVIQYWSNTTTFSSFLYPVSYTIGDSYAATAGN